MSIYAYEDADKYLKEALDARSKILKSQEYHVSGRTQKRALLSEVDKDIEKWEKEVKSILAANPELSTTTQKRRRGPRIKTIGYRR